MNNNDYFDEDDDVESDFPSADNFFSIFSYTSQTTSLEANCIVYLNPKILKNELVKGFDSKQFNLCFFNIVENTLIFRNYDRPGSSNIIEEFVVYDVSNLIKE
jgi:hypothetical protein